MYSVKNLPSNFKCYKYIVVKDLRNYTEIRKRLRGYWFYGCYDSLDSAQKAVDEFKGTKNMYVVIMETKNVIPA